MRPDDHIVLFPYGFLVVGLLAGLLSGYMLGSSLSRKHVAAKPAAPPQIRTLAQLAARLGKPLNTFAGADIGLPAGTRCVQWVVVNGHFVILGCWK